MQQNVIEVLPNNQQITLEASFRLTIASGLLFKVSSCHTDTCNHLNETNDDN